MPNIFTPLLARISPLKQTLSEDDLSIEVDAKNLFNNIEFAASAGFDYLVDITAVDYLSYPKTPVARYAMVYILRSTDFKSLLTIKSFIINEEVESITQLFKAANWLEREVYDQYGIKFTNHPNLKRVLNHHEFVGHPLRKDYIITNGQHCSIAESLMDEMDVQLEKHNLKDEEHMFLNLGPSHPASHGTIRTLVALDGERIKAAVTEIGYLHRGFEKSAEHHTYSQVIPYTDRLNYCSAVMNNVGYVKTLEEMLGVHVPKRAEQIRVMLMELSRIMDHLVFLAAQLVDMGALTNYWYLYNPREDVYNFLSKLSGARLTNSYMRIGGMSHDLYDGYEEDLQTIITNVQKGCADALALIKHNRIFHDRAKDVGIISAKDALSYGWSGPNLRACGVNSDMRYLKPYYGYDELDFDVVLGSHGDVYDRIMVRFEEIEQSIKIVKQIQATLIDGEINIADRSIILPQKKEVYTSIEGVMNQFKLTFEGIKVKPQEYYGSIEAVNGELGFYVVSDGSGTPYKMKVRAPSFLHIAALPEIIQEYQLADAVITLASLNIIAGEMDR